MFFFRIVASIANVIGLMRARQPSASLKASFLGVCYMPVTLWELIPQRHSVSQIRAQVSTNQKLGTDLGIRRKSRCRRGSLDPWHLSGNLEFCPPPLPPAVWRPGSRLALSSLFQNGTATLAGPPSSMSPQSRYLIFTTTPPVLLTAGGERQASVVVPSMGSSAPTRQAWFLCFGI